MQRGLLVVVTLLLAGPAFSADLPVRPAPAAKPAPEAKPAPAAKPAASSNHGALSPPDSTCLEWTDGCRTCQRPAGGEAACSNVGIACVPKEAQCTRR